MPRNLQAKLLRVIQEGKVRRIGGKEEIPINVRIIAATNVNPKILLETGELRSDLYYRLNVIYIEIPPLRHRKEDIPLLVDHYVLHYNNIFEKQVVGVDDETMEYFMDYEWHGNIRELRNMIELAMNVVTLTTFQKTRVHKPIQPFMMPLKHLKSNESRKPWFFVMEMFPKQRASSISPSRL